MTEQAHQQQPLFRPLLSIVLLCGTAVVAASALELSETELFFELNDTDGELGIHASIDGGPYKSLEIEGPRGRTLLRVNAYGHLARQGLTQLMLESAEPTFDELSPRRFFRRFPEGRYEIEVSRGRQEFETEVELSHVMAAPPEARVNGISAAESCDADELPVVSEPVVIDWEPVTASHPEIGREGMVNMVRYQFFVEQGDTQFGVDLPPETTEFQVPLAITKTGGEFKFEIIARTADLNNTAIESCFVLE